MIDQRTSPYAALLLRVSLGLMFIAHGLLKWLVFTLPGTAEFFASVGFPGWTAYPVTALEIAGGIALLLGVYVRPIAVVLVLELVGVTLVHFSNGWLFSNANGGWEYPVFLLVACISLSLLGEGAFAFKPGQPGASSGR